MRFAMRFCTPVLGTALISEGVWLTLSSVMQFNMRLCTTVHIGTALISCVASCIMQFTMRFDMRFNMRFDMPFDMQFCTTVHIGTALVTEGVWLTLGSETIGAIDPGSANPSAVLDSVLDSAT